MLKVVAFLQVGIFVMYAVSSILSANVEARTPIGPFGLPYNTLCYLKAGVVLLASACIARTLLYLPAIDSYACADNGASAHDMRSFRRSFLTMFPFMAWGGVETLLVLHMSVSEQDIPHQLVLDQLVHSLGMFLIGLGIEDLRRFLIRLRDAAGTFSRKPEPVRVSYKFYGLAWIVCVSAAVVPVLQTWHWHVEYRDSVNEAQLILEALEGLGVFVCGWSICGLIRIWCQALAGWKMAARQYPVQPRSLLGVCIALAPLVALGLWIYSDSTVNSLVRLVQFVSIRSLFSIVYLLLFGSSISKIIGFMVWLLFCWQVYRLRLTFERLPQKGEVPGDLMPPDTRFWRIAGFACLVLCLPLAVWHMHLTVVSIAVLGTLVGEIAGVHRTLWIRAHSQ